MSNNKTPIIMTEDYWMNTHLSIARHYGGVVFNGHQYIIVNQRGMDLWECTAEANRLGRSMAIPPGEPADLIRDDFQKLYKKLGRERFIEIIKNNNVSDKELKQIMKHYGNRKENNS